MSTTPLDSITEKVSSALAELHDFLRSEDGSLSAGAMSMAAVELESFGDTLSRRVAELKELSIAQLDEELSEALSR